MGATFEQQYGHIIKDFQEWFNNQEYRAICMGTPITIDDEDVEEYIKMKMERWKQ